MQKKINRNNNHHKNLEEALNSLLWQPYEYQNNNNNNNNNNDYFYGNGDYDDYDDYSSISSSNTISSSTISIDLDDPNGNTDTTTSAAVSSTSKQNKTKKKTLPSSDFVQCYYTITNTPSTTNTTSTLNPTTTAIVPIINDISSSSSSSPSTSCTSTIVPPPSRDLHSNVINLKRQELSNQWYEPFDARDHFLHCSNSAVAFVSLPTLASSNFDLCSFMWWDKVAAVTTIEETPSSSLSSPPSCVYYSDECNNKNSEQLNSSMQSDSSGLNTHHNGTASSLHPLSFSTSSENGLRRNSDIHNSLNAVNIVGLPTSHSRFASVPCSTSGTNTSFHKFHSPPPPPPPSLQGTRIQYNNGTTGNAIYPNHFRHISEPSGTTNQYNRYPPNAIGSIHHKPHDITMNDSANSQLDQHNLRLINHFRCNSVPKSSTTITAAGGAAALVPIRNDITNVSSASCNNNNNNSKVANNKAAQVLPQNTAACNNPRLSNNTIVNNSNIRLVHTRPPPVTTTTTSPPFSASSAASSGYSYSSVPLNLQNIQFENMKISHVKTTPLPSVSASLSSTSQPPLPPHPPNTTTTTTTTVLSPPQTLLSPPSSSSATYPCDANISNINVNFYKAVPVYVNPFSAVHSVNNTSNHPVNNDDQGNSVSNVQVLPLSSSQLPGNVHHQPPSYHNYQHQHHHQGAALASNMINNEQGILLHPPTSCNSTNNNSTSTRVTVRNANGNAIQIVDGSANHSSHIDCSKILTSPVGVDTGLMFNNGINKQRSIEATAAGLVAATAPDVNRGTKGNVIVQNDCCENIRNITVNKNGGMKLMQNNPPAEPINVASASVVQVQSNVHVTTAAGELTNAAGSNSTRLPPSSLPHQHSVRTITTTAEINNVSISSNMDSDYPAVHGNTTGLVRTRTFTSTEAQTDDIPPEEPHRSSQNQRLLANAAARERRKRERKTRHRQNRRTINNQPGQSTRNVQDTSTQAGDTQIQPSDIPASALPANDMAPPPNQQQMSRLPDILHSHLPPPYSALPPNLPSQIGLTSQTTLPSVVNPGAPQPPASNIITPQLPPPPALPPQILPPSPTPLVPRTILPNSHGPLMQSVLPNGVYGSGYLFPPPQQLTPLMQGARPLSVAISATGPSGLRFGFSPNSFRRSRFSEDSPKNCCGFLSWRPGSLRWFIGLIALVAVCCVVVGTALGAMRPSGRDHLTVSLLMIGVGIVLITVSGVAWRLTSQDASSCRSMLGFGSSESVEVCTRRFVPRLPPSYGRPHHPYAAMMYPEFQYRPPPPSYQASMQEYRLRLLLLDRANSPQMQNTIQNAVSPPPTYRSHAGSLLRGTLSNRREICQSEYSCPPSYRSQNSPNRAGTLQSGAILHSRDPSLTLSDSNHESVVNVVNILESTEEDIALDNLTLDSLKLDPETTTELNTLKMLLKGSQSDLDETKDGNLVTIVQTNDQNPVIVTVSGCSQDTNSQVQITEVSPEMEILAHL